MGGEGGNGAWAGGTSGPGRDGLDDGGGVDIKRKYEFQP